ncbi:MAG: tyrosine-type recombinase/integrase [Firmicutes bacterium]|nr:tyrosine-type recombinase/integrase [Candidatus Colivicinus equi]
MVKDSKSKRSPNLELGTTELLKECNKESLKLLEKYKIDMSLRELSPKSIENYLSDISQWFRYIKIYQDDKCITDLEEEDLTEFFYFGKMGGNSTRRNKRRMSSVSAFYKFLRKKKIITENPMEFIDRPKKDIDVYVQTFLSQEQVDLMKQKLIEYGDLQLYTYAMLSLSTMARVTAISNLTWDQNDFDERTFNDVLEKEGKVVTLYYSLEVRDLLKQLIQYRKDNDIDDKGYVFYTGQEDHASKSTLTEWAHKIGNMIDVPELHPHDFRHSGSQLMLLNDAPIELISELLNHSGLDVTKKHYLRPDKKKTQANKDKYAAI